MSTPEVIYAEHQVHETIATLKDVVSKPELAHDKPAQQATIARIKAFPEYVETVLESVVPALVKPEQLNNLNTHLNSAQSQAAAYVSSKNVQHLNQANAAIDQCFTIINQLPKPYPEFTARSFSQSAVEFQNQSKVLYEQLAAKAEQISGNLDKLSSAIENVDPVVANHQSKIKEAQEQVEALVPEFDAKIKELTTNTEQQQAIQLQEHREDFVAANAEREKEFSKQADSFTTTAENTVKFMSDKEAEVSKLVGIIGNKGTTGNFANWADNHASSGVRFLIAAVTIMVVLSFYLVYIQYYPPTLSGYAGAVLRVSVVVTLLSVAVFMSRQAVFYRNESKVYRDTETKLSAFGPWLEQGPEEMRHELWKDFTSKIFGPVSGPSADQSPMGGLSSLVQFPKKASGD